MNSIKGHILVNSFYKTEKFMEHYHCLQSSAEKQGVELDIIENSDNLSEENAAFLDITLASICKKVSDNSTIASIIIEELDNKIAVTMDLPDFKAISSGKDRKYIVIRIHGSKAEKLPDADITVTDTKIKFLSDKFSTYVITFEDTDKATPAPRPLGSIAACSCSQETRAFVTHLIYQVTDEELYLFAACDFGSDWLYHYCKLNLLPGKYSIKMIEEYIFHDSSFRLFKLNNLINNL